MRDKPLSNQATAFNKLELFIRTSECGTWLGGAIYIENLVNALLSLPDYEQPVITVVDSETDETGLRNRLKRLPLNFYDSDDPFKSCLFKTLPKIITSWARHLLGPGPGYFSGTMSGLWFPVMSPNQFHAPKLFWIPDFQHFYLPEMFSGKEIQERNLTYRKIAQTSGFLLLSSKSSLRDFRNLFPEARIKPRIWSFGSFIDVSGGEDVIEIKNKIGLPERFAYIANQFWMHKDHLTVFRAIAMLRDQGLVIPVVCSGSHDDYRNPLYFENVKETISDLRLDNQIFLTGIIPREDQIKVLRMAACVIQPSLFEGWSTVIEDAKSVGRAVVASDIDVHREQLIDSEIERHFFIKADPGSLARLLLDIWPTLRAGPDYQLERSMALQAKNRQIETAREFMRIARETIASFPDGPYAAGSFCK